MVLVDVALLVGFLFAVGVFLLFEKHLLSVFFGVALLSNAANVFVLAMSGPPEGRRSPLVGEGASIRTTDVPVDPLPQALILTAIVIGSGVLVYAIFLIHRLFTEHGTTDVARIYADAPETGPVPAEAGDAL